MSAELLSLLIEEKPKMFAHPSNAVSQWRECWNMLIYQIPMMWKNKEEWFYYNRNVRGTMCAKDTQIQEEFRSLERQGLTLCDDTKVNEMNIYAIIPHPKKKKLGLRAEFKFYRYLGEEDDEGNCKGSGLCPILWGIGAYADGLTYVKVKITEVPVPKDQVQVGLNLLNGRY